MNIEGDGGAESLWSNKARLLGGVSLKVTIMSLGRCSFFSFRACGFVF